MTFNETKRLIVDAAKSQAAMNAHNTVFEAKRLIGRKFSDPGVQSDKHTPIPNKATPPPTTTLSQRTHLQSWWSYRNQSLPDPESP